MFLVLLALYCVIGILVEVLYYHYGTSEYEKLISGYGAAEIFIPAFFGIFWIAIRAYDVYDDHKNRTF